MEQATYAVEANVEASHWWFVARRRLLSTLIRSLGMPPNADILDLGTGTGTNLRLLKELCYVNVVGLDASETAIQLCAAKGLGPVHQGDICHLPFASDRFQLILATDTLEHVEDDAQALLELARVLAPDGTAILTVPAFPCLWGLQDEVADHRRRYHLKELEGRLRQAGLRCIERFYFNYLLFVPIWVARRLIRGLRIQLASENQLNTAWLNRLLTLIFTVDVWSARWMRPPFGVSILVMAKKALPHQTPQR